MKNLLVLSFFPAFVPPKSGGEVRLFYFYRELSKRFNVRLLSSGVVGEAPTTLQHAPTFTEVRVGKQDDFLAAWQQLAPAAGAGDLSAPAVALTAGRLNHFTQVYLDNHAWADAVIHESPFTCFYDIFSGLDSKPRIYASYNCESDLYRRLHASERAAPIHAVVSDAESAILRAASLVTYCAEADRDAFLRMGVPADRLTELPNGMHLSIPRRADADRGVRHVVFLGSAHLPNVEAARFIVDRLAPACKGIDFHVIGSCLPEGDYPRNVIRHGLVDNAKKRELLELADVAINPMFTGGGSSLKILDFISCGLPLLTTEIGMRGFGLRPNVDCKVVDPEEFAAVLLGTGQRLSYWLPMARSALDAVKQKYTWDRLADTFEAALAALPAQRGRPRVLVLNDFNPYTSVGGGATRLQGSLAAWSAERDVICLHLSDGERVEVLGHGPGIWTLGIPKTAAQAREEERLNGLFHVATNDIVASRFVLQNEVLGRVYDALRQNADTIVCEHPYLAPLPIDRGDAFVYSSQNDESSLKREALKWHPEASALIGSVETLERTAIDRCSLLITVSEEDALSMTAGKVSGPPSLVIPNGAARPAPASPEDLAEVRDLVQRDVVAFLGSAHMPNVDAAKFIVEELAPSLPKVLFVIVGSVCGAIVSKPPANVLLKGVVRNGLKTAILQSAKLAVNPVVSGSGSNVKLADFLANGLFVLSTEFGVRGYLKETLEHAEIAPLSEFAQRIQVLLGRPELWAPSARQRRVALFERSLSMEGIAGRALPYLFSPAKPLRKLLFVTYRFGWPLRGGAEAMLYQMLKSLSEAGDFCIDVACADVSVIEEAGRFAARYKPSGDAAPLHLGRVRYRRFPCDGAENEAVVSSRARAAWDAQIVFEREVFERSAASRAPGPGLAWGWGPVEGSAEQPGRWGLCECGVVIDGAGHVRISGFSPWSTVLMAESDEGDLLFHDEVSQWFSIEFFAKGRLLILSSSRARVDGDQDVRPLGIYVSSLVLDGVPLSMAGAIGAQDRQGDAPEVFGRLLAASRASRDRCGVSLTDVRGPFSLALEDFVYQEAGRYDLVLTHNSVFRPAVVAIDAARQAGVPSILIPHAHLDDDFYHFEDVHRAALDATLVLAAPRQAVDFYSALGVRQVDYLGAGIDTSDVAGPSDRQAFREAAGFDGPFFLVLGRKAHAKGYLSIIEAFKSCRFRQKNLRLVMIGPDDDGRDLAGQPVSYLGPQPRAVVRGALAECLALVNMSVSESFGIVLLEAWMHGRPVIANRECPAFLDLAVDDHNALLVDESSIGKALLRLEADPALAERLGSNGRALVPDYSWSKIGSDFVAHCRRLVS